MIITHVRAGLHKGGRSCGWHDTAFDVYPEDGQLVEVPNNGGCQLVYHSGLWWVPDMSMYVYYTPKYWKAVPTNNERLY